jgi:hypothetical protein
MDVTYWTLNKGRLVEEDGYIGNRDWPLFENTIDAQNFLKDHNINGKVIE